MRAGPPPSHQANTERRTLDDSSAAARHIAQTFLTEGTVGRVGLELEAHCFDLRAPQRRPSWEELTAVIADVPALPGGSVISIEPGGAVELSGPPAVGAASAIAALRADRRTLQAVFARAGLGLALLGADPLRHPNRINPGARYRAMERYFEATGTPSAGAAMMTSTASIQVNLDAGPPDQWAERIRLAHSLGPTMLAIAASSPMLSGEFTGWVSSRQRVWGELDSARCGPVLGVSGDAPGTDWARYALHAPVMLVHGPDPIAVGTRVPFAAWADGRVLLGGRRPTVADLDYHLTTLFPPVRPRRWLEIRYLDSVPDSLWPAIVFTIATLLDDPQAAELARAAVAPVATAWEVAARLGLADDAIHAAAQRCVAAAAADIPAELVDSMELLIGNVEERRSPALCFIESVVRRGVVPAVLHAAEETP